MNPIDSSRYGESNAFGKELASYQLYLSRAGALRCRKVADGGGRGIPETAAQRFEAVGAGLFALRALKETDALDPLGGCGRGLPSGAVSHTVERGGGGSYTVFRGDEGSVGDLVPADAGGEYIRPETFRDVWGEMEATAVEGDE